MFDDRGRWASLRQGRWLAAVSRHLDRGAAAAPVVLSVDLRGWGDSAPAATPYDLVGWSGSDRWASYVSSSLGDGLLGQRVRDAVAACRWLTGLETIDPRRVVLAGHGLGGLVALMAAAMVEYVAGVVCVDSPWSIEDIVAEPGYTWDRSVFLPRVLERLDVRPLADAVAPVLMVRPRDAVGHVLRDDPDSAAVEWVWKRMGI
jgi:pimeloyl-ACP methyl ester carboxylesterase